MGTQNANRASVETEHLLCFRLSSSHLAVRVYSFFKRNDLNRRRFQNPCFKARAELFGDLPYLLRGQSIAVDSKQPGGIVIKVDEIETDAGIPA